MSKTARSKTKKQGKPVAPARNQKAMVPGDLKEQKAPMTFEQPDAGDPEQEDTSDESTDSNGQPRRKGEGLRYVVLGRAIRDGEKRVIATRDTLGQARKVLAQCREMMSHDYTEFWLERVQRIEL
jgi:hypothetical protein